MQIKTLATLLLLSTQCSAFTPATIKGRLHLQKQRQHNVLFATSSEDRRDNDSNNKLDARTCVRNFLTQRSVQSFMFLTREMRDPYTNAWMEDFLGSKNLLSFHGSGALDLERFNEWDCVFTELMDKPADVVIVEIAKNHVGGMSKNNPHRKELEKGYEIEIDIDPPSLANRILAVRDKLSKEWAHDLELLISVNEKILPTYTAKQKEDRVLKEKKSKDDTDANAKGIAPLLQPNQAGNMSGDFKFGQRTDQIFERDAVYLINNHPAFGSGGTNLRASSFDLLFLLSLQESIHRILTSYREEGEGKEVSYAWLNKFYKESLEKYFDGNQSFGRADDFMDDLLSTPPALKTIGNAVGFIDPIAIAEDIISVRGEVASEWKKLMENTELDHMDIRADIFRLQMEKWGQPLSQSVNKPAKTDEKKKAKKSNKKNKKDKKDKKDQKPKDESKAELKKPELIFSSDRPGVIQGGDFE